MNRNCRRIAHLLHESITLAASQVFLLELHKLEIAEWFEDVPQIFLCYRKVDVPNIQAMKGDAIGLSCCTFGTLLLTILLCFGQLCDDGNPNKLLPGQSDSLLYGFFVTELNIADAIGLSVSAITYCNGRYGIPFTAPAHSVLHNLSINHRPDLLEERLKIFGSKSGSELLYEDRAPITLIISGLGFPLAVVVL